MPETEPLATRLAVDLGDQACPPAGAHMIVADAACLEPDAVPESVDVLLYGRPWDHPAWTLRGGVSWVVTDGLEEAARLRDQRPELSWLPRVAAFQPPVRYRCGGRYPGEGFRVFTPDTRALAAHWVDDGDRSLGEWLTAATALGFPAVWLFSRDAARDGSGLDLELLDRGRRCFAGGIWLSGGATEAVHLEALRREGGCQGVVVPAAMEAGEGLEALHAALVPPPSRPDPSDTVEVPA